MCKLRVQVGRASRCGACAQVIWLVSVSFSVLEFPLRRQLERRGHRRHRRRRRRRAYLPPRSPPRRAGWVLLLPLKCPGVGAACGASSLLCWAAAGSLPCGCPKLCAAAAACPKQSARRAATTLGRLPAILRPLAGRGCLPIARYRMAAASPWRQRQQLRQRRRRCGAGRWCRRVESCVSCQR